MKPRIADETWQELGVQVTLRQLLAKARRSAGGQDRAGAPQRQDEALLEDRQDESPVEAPHLSAPAIAPLDDEPMDEAEAAESEANGPEDEEEAEKTAANSAESKLDALLEEVNESPPKKARTEPNSKPSTKPSTKPSAETIPEEHHTMMKPQGISLQPLDESGKLWTFWAGESAFGGKALTRTRKIRAKTWLACIPGGCLHEGEDGLPWNLTSATKVRHIKQQDATIDKLSRVIPDYHEHTIQGRDGRKKSKLCWTPGKDSAAWAKQAVKLLKAQPAGEQLVQSAWCIDVVDGVMMCKGILLYAAFGLKFDGGASGALRRQRLQKCQQEDDKCQRKSEDGAGTDEEDAEG